MVLTWEQYKTLKESLDKGVDDLTAVAMIGASEIPILGPVLMAAASGLLKFGLRYIVNNLVPHEFQSTLETDPEWIDRLEKGEAVPLSPNVDPGSWTKERRMRWQNPENRKKWDELVNKVKNDQKLNNILTQPLTPIMQDINPIMQDINNRYLNLPVTFDVYNDFKSYELDHPYSTDQGNAVYPGAVQGKYKPYKSKILTLNDLIRNKKYNTNI